MQYTITNYKTLYGLLGTTFPDNTVGAISEGDMRQFGEDSADSLIFAASSVGVTSVVTTGGVITFDFASKAQILFIGATSFATPKTIALSNDANARKLEFIFNITNSAAILTFPSTFFMNDVRWDPGAKTWTPDDIGIFKGAAIFDGTNWLLDISSSPYA